MTIRSRLITLLIIFSGLLGALFVTIFLNISGINSNIGKIDAAIRHVSMASQINHSIFDQFESSLNYLLWGNEEDRTKALQSRQYIDALFYKWSKEEILNEHILQTEKPLQMRREYNHIMEALMSCFRLRNIEKTDQAVIQYNQSINDAFEKLIFHKLADVNMEEQNNFMRGYDNLLFELGIVPWLNKKIVARINRAKTNAERFILVSTLTSRLNKLHKDGFDFILNDSIDAYEDFKTDNSILTSSLENLKKQVEIQMVYDSHGESENLKRITSLQEVSLSLYDLFNRAFALKRKGKDKEAFNLLKIRIKPLMHNQILPLLKILTNDSLRKIGNSHHQLRKTTSSAMIVISMSALLLFISMLYIIIKIISGILSALTVLKAGAGEIGKGNLDYKIHLNGRNELAEFARIMNNMSEQLCSTTVSRNLLLQEVEERKRTEKKLLATKEELEASNEELALLNEELEATNEELLSEIEERQKLEEDLIKSRKQAEAASQAKSQFLANMSHDLRTPLNAVIGFSEILSLEAVGELNDRQKDCINDILESGQHLLSLINQILDLSRIEAGKFELNYSQVQINDLVETTLIFVKEKAAHKGIDMSTEFSNNEMTVETDKLRLKQVLINLIGNAVKFTPHKGKISIKVDKGESEKNIFFSIEDTGTGIREEDMSKVFNTFEQADSSYTKEYEGSGLGLALSRRIVELLGGKIWVESEFGKGSTFSFKIPNGRFEVQSS